MAAKCETSEAQKEYSTTPKKIQTSCKGIINQSKGPLCVKPFLSKSFRSNLLLLMDNNLASVKMVDSPLTTVI